MFDDESNPLPLYTRRGLADFLAQDIRPPERITLTQHGEFDDASRTEFDRRRRRYASRGILLNTPQVHAGVKKVVELLDTNAGLLSDRHGLMISGSGTFGKTTVTKAIMRETIRLYRQEFPEYEYMNRLPIVYVEAPPGSTGKSLMQAFADAIELTYTERETMHSLLRRVTGLLRESRTALVVVDELHRLANGNSGNGESVDVLRALLTSLNATFVYAGVALAEGALLNGPTGRQITGRFSLIRMDPYSSANEIERTSWRKLVAGFESTLPLFAQPKGSLVAMSDLLMARTGGSINTLHKALSACTVELIRAGAPEAETISEEQIRGLLLNIDAEEDYTSHLNASKAQTRKATKRRAA